MATTVPLDRLDEHFLVLDREAEPWNVHFEALLSERLDADRLASAVAAAMRRHPIARASLADARPYERRYHWEIAEAPAVPLTVAECHTEPEVDAARESLLRRSPSLQTAPPFELLLAHGPDGDTLVLNLHHAAGDGIAAARLMRSILLVYTGETDPAPPLDPLAVRDVTQLAGAKTREDRNRRHRAVMRRAATTMLPPARLAPRGGDDRSGYGVARMALTGAETQAVVALRPDGTTVNDVLLAALAIAARRWNVAHGRRAWPITLTMPVNLRPAAWRDEVVGNFASYVSVVVAVAPEGVGPTAEAVGAQTSEIKRHGLAGVVIDLLAGPSLSTIAAKHRLVDLIPLMGNVVVDTASLSNLGALPSLPGHVQAVWFSPPSRMPLGAALGVLTHGERLHLTLRYRHAEFDRAAAEQFLALFRGVLAWPADGA